MKGHPLNQERIEFGVLTNLSESASGRSESGVTCNCPTEDTY